MSVITYERRRIRTIRSTWVAAVVTVALGALTALLFATLGGPGAEVIEGAPVTTMEVLYSALFSPLVVVPLSVIAATAFGGEYRFGIIRLTLALFPTRTRVFLAKMWVTIVWMVAVLIVTALAIVLVGFIFRNNIDFDPFTVDNLAFVARCILFGVGYGLIVFALVVLTRNQALSIVLALIWMLVVEGLIGSLLITRLPWLINALPMNRGSEYVNTGAWEAAAVFGAWVVGLLVIAWAVFSRRDA